MAGFDPNANDEVLAAALGLRPPGGNAYYDPQANNDVLAILGQPPQDDLTAFHRAVTGGPPTRQPQNQEIAPNSTTKAVTRAPGVAPDVAGAPGAPAPAGPPPLTAPPPGYAPPVRQNPPVAPPGAAPGQMAGPARPGAPLTYEQQVAADTANKEQDTSTLTDAQAAQQDIQASGEAKAAAENDARVNDNAKLMQDAKRQTDADMAAVNAKADELMQMHPDPKRLYKQASTGEKVATLISFFLGGIYSYEHGGENPALTAVNKAIDRDMQAQAQDFEQQKAGLDEKRGVLGQKITADQDYFHNMEAMRAAKYDAAIAMTKAQVDAAQSPITKANGKILLDDLDAAKTATLKAAADKRFEQNIQKAQVGIAAGHLRLEQDNAIRGQYNTTRAFKEEERMDDARIREMDGKLAAAQAAAAKAGQEDAVINPYTMQTMGQANGKESAEKIREYVANAAKLRSHLMELKASYDKDGKEFGGVWGERGATASSKQRRETTATARAEWAVYQKVPFRGGADVIKDAIPGGWGWTDNDPRPRLDQAIKNLDMGMDAYLRATTTGYDGQMSGSVDGETPGGELSNAEEMIQMRARDKARGFPPMETVDTRVPKAGDDGGGVGFTSAMRSRLSTPPAPAQPPPDFASDAAFHQAMGVAPPDPLMELDARARANEMIRLLSHGRLNPE